MSDSDVNVNQGLLSSTRVRVDDTGGAGRSAR